MGPKLEARVREVLETFRLSGVLVNSTKIAQQIATEFPDCGRSIDELSMQIAMEAAREGIPVELDPSPEA